MKEQKRMSTEDMTDTNLYPIYPDIDTKIDPSAKEVTDEELIQQTDTINPDPNSLDRG